MIIWWGAAEVGEKEVSTQLLALMRQCQYSNSWPIALHASLSFARNIISLNHMNNVNRARVAPLMLSHYRFPLEKISEA